MKFSIKTVLCIAACAASSLAAAATFPDKPIRVVVPYSAGGAVDVITRIIGEEMSKDLGQPIIVDPRPGGEGSIAALAVARAEPDGYTLLSSSAVITSIPLLFQNLQWGTKDFAGIGRFATSSGFIISSAKIPPKTLPEMAEYAKKHPQTPAAVLIGGAFTTFVTKLFSNEGGLDLLFVQYPGAAKHMVDLYEGRVSLATVSGNLACSSLTNPRVNVLATTGPTRTPFSPNVPTVTEAGFPQTDVTGWYGLHAPAGTPQAVIDRLATSLGKALESPKFKEGLSKAFVNIAFMKGQEFDSFVRNDVKRWTHMVKEVGTKK